MVKGKLLESGASDSLNQSDPPREAGLAENTEDDAFGDGASKDLGQPTPMRSVNFERLANDDQP
jgi:hypothetical protein